MMDNVAVHVQGHVSAIGLNDGTLSITDSGGSRIVKVTEGQKKSILPKIKVGEMVSLYARPDGTVQGLITIGDKAAPQSQSFVPGSSYAGEGPRQVNKYPTKDEQRIVETSEKQNYILWQSCMKIAVEIEKFFVGGVEDRQQTVKEIITVTNALYEASQRKMRGLPPIEEVRGG